MRRLSLIGLGVAFVALSACASGGLNPAQRQVQEKFDICREETGATSVSVVFIREDGTGLRFRGNTMESGRVRECLRSRFGYKFPAEPGYRGVLR